MPSPTSSAPRVESDSAAASLQAFREQYRAELENFYISLLTAADVSVWPLRDGLTRPAFDEFVFQNTTVSPPPSARLSLLFGSCL